jgi:transcription antitermination factor NusG
VFSSGYLTNAPVSEVAKLYVAMENLIPLNSSANTIGLVSTKSTGDDSSTRELRWYAAYTNARHEKYVARQLQDRRMDNFLPLYRSVRCWKDRRKEIDLPLFPSYVFVRLAINSDRTRVLQIPGVVRFVSFNGRPAPLENEEIESLKNAVADGHAEPHPYLKIGRRVRIKRGPLAGIEGILVRKKDKFRVVISLDLIMRSVATEIEASDLE